MIRKIMKLSLKSILNNKMRSFLTMLGIIIGVMAVVILVSITQGAATGITDSISDMGLQPRFQTVRFPFRPMRLKVLKRILPLTAPRR